MEQLINKIKAFFGDKYTYSEYRQSRAFFTIWIQGEHSNIRNEVKTIDVNVAKYYDGYGELENYLKSL